MSSMGDPLIDGPLAEPYFLIAGGH